MTAERPRRIVHAIARLNVGGAALHVMELAAEQIRRGHDVLVVAGTLAEGEESMEWHAEELGVPLVRLPELQRELSLRHDPAAIWKLRRLLDERRPDVLHTHTAKAGSTGRVAALSLPRSRRPRALVHTFHGHVLRGYFSPRRSKAFALVERALGSRAGALVAVSEQVRDDLVLLGVAPWARIEVIPYGFDLSGRVDGGERLRVRAELGVDGQLLVGWVGRLTAIKQPLDAVRTLTRLRSEGVDAVLAVAGDGEERPATEALARELGVLPYVRFLGYVKDLAGLYAAVDALLLTSLNEGTPVAAIEALAAERPVVATRVGGIPAVVGDGEDGFLAASGDVDGLAHRLAELARDPGLRTRLGRHGAERMREHYSAGRMVDAIDALYERLLAPVKVLHVHKLKGVGGSEGHLLALLPALRERGVDARFLGLDVEGSDAPRFYRELDELAVPYRQVRCGPDVSLRMAAEVDAAVREEAPDLLHTHLVHADVYGTLASLAERVPLVSTRHNDDRYLLGPFRFVDRAFGRRARRLVAISNAVRSFLVEAGHPAERIETIHYGLDRLPDAPSEIAPPPPGPPLLLAIGRLTAQKDHPTMLRAFADARPRHPNALLAILGIGPLEAETRALVAELGLDGAVLLPGRLQVRDWLERADVFVHTSRWEGFGLVLLEAMLAGLPVAATRVSAVPEVVADGETGLLVEPGDVAALADALDGLLGDAKLRERLGTAGVERARRRFSVGRMADRTVALYESVA